MKEEPYLTDVDQTFFHDLQNPEFADGVRAEMDKLSSTVAIRKKKQNSPN
ncbi:hypothetical protein [Lentilactobacillus diolivorans]|uniref:Uncharacterized protein n=1 Tax=Lentilactobacillus diolivorans TaxID=179838 RepID=A0ABQ0XFT4_9LACO|nr:hypothetical protein [Lentilactobacillus diolivorans]GEP23284.1 hypothetical protein LDI01_08770 [Lentilactobacillus diolivorans]